MSAARRHTFSISVALVLLLLFGWLFRNLLFINRSDTIATPDPVATEQIVEGVLSDSPQSSIEREGLPATTTAETPTITLRVRTASDRPVTFNVEVYAETFSTKARAVKSIEDMQDWRAIAMIPAGQTIGVPASVVRNGLRLFSIGRGGFFVQGAWSGNIVTFVFPDSGDVSIRIYGRPQGEFMRVRIASTFSSLKEFRHENDRLELPSLPHGFYSITAECRGLKGYCMISHESEHSDGEITLSPFGTLNLHISDTSGLQAVSNASIIINPHYSLDVANHGNGQYSITGIPPSTPFILFVVRAEGFPDQFLEAYLDGPGNIWEKRIQLSGGIQLQFRCLMNNEVLPGSITTVFYRHNDWFETGRQLHGNATGIADMFGMVKVAIPSSGEVVGALSEDYTVLATKTVSGAEISRSGVNVVEFLPCMPLSLEFSSESSSTLPIRVGTFAPFAQENVYFGQNTFYTNSMGDLVLTLYPQPMLGISVETITGHPILTRRLTAPLPRSVQLRIPEPGSVSVRLLRENHTPEVGIAEVYSIDRVNLLATAVLDVTGAVSFVGLPKDTIVLCFRQDSDSEVVLVDYIRSGGEPKEFVRNNSTNRFLPLLNR